MCPCLLPPTAPTHADDVQEVTLLLPTWQVEALATAARQRGLTTGQLMRRVLRDFCLPENDGAERGDAAPLW